MQKIIYNKLFIGDVDESLATIAKTYNPDAVLLTGENYKNSYDVAYTCLADMQSLENFYEVCSYATKIEYHLPAHWSDQTPGNSSKQKYWTEHVLYYFAQFKSVYNLAPIEKHYFLEFLNTPSRRSDSEQLWVAGCSITNGDHLSHDQTWKELVSKQLHIEYNDLSKEGSSITWSANQICLADIAKDDIVFWQLTFQNRVPIIHNKKQRHLHGRSFEEHPELLNDFNINLIDKDNDNLYYNNVLAVRQVYNFCSKIGAKLVILGGIVDWDSVYTLYNIPCFKQVNCWPHQYVDLAKDNVHPGPEQHKIYATEFLNMYNTLYAKDNIS